MLKKQNGFYWGFYRFFAVLDDDDKYHTFNDVVVENANPNTGWKQYLPESYVAIANEDHFCLVVNTNKDGVVYEYNHQTGDIEQFAKNDTELEEKLNHRQNELQLD